MIKNNFRNIEEAKFIYEFKEKNLKLWEEISKKKFHTNDYEIENVPNAESEKSNFTNESEVSIEQSEVSTEQSESNTFMIYVLILSIFIILLFIYINIRRNKT